MFVVIAYFINFSIMIFLFLNRENGRWTGTVCNLEASYESIFYMKLLSTG